MQIVTGRRGEPHVTSRQMQAVYRSFLGDFALLDIGEKLRAEAYSDDIVRVYDGVVSVQGIYAVIAYNQYDEVYIEPVSVGKKRIDTIVLHYTKDNSEDVEDMQLDVVQGEEYTDNPIAPVVPEGGDAWEGTTDIQVPIYDVEVTNFGLTVTPYARMLTVIPTLDSIAERIPETVVTGVKGDSEVLYRDGDVNITKANIGLGNVDNTADTDKPISTATQTALNLKADLVYVNAVVASAYHAGGNLTVAELTSALLITENMGKVYNMSDSGVTTADFVEGAGKPIREGDDIGICNRGTEENPIYKFNLLSGFVDLSAYATTAAVNAGLAGKVDKVAGKGLSTKDYTSADKTKLAGISEGATQTIANPADTATETLSKLEVEGVVYDIPQGASGATELSELTDVNLSDVEDGDILQYDETANKWKNSNALQGAKTATGNPITVTDAAPVNAVNLSMDLAPIQDLHGYDHPWVGGAGKNKLPPFTSTTVQGVTITVNAQGAVTLNGTATGNGNINIGVSLKAGTYKISGAYGNSDFYKSETMGNNNRMYIYDGSSTYFDNVSGGREFTLSQDTTCTVYLVFVSGYTFNNSVVYPMIRLSTETDSSFAPYTNYASISGRSEVAINGVGKNLCRLIDGITYGKLIDNGVVVDSVAGSWVSELMPISDFDTLYIKVFEKSSYTSGSVVFYESVDGVNYTQIGVISSTSQISDGYSNSYAISSSAKYLRISGYMAGNTSSTKYIESMKLMLALSPITTYEPYQGKTYTIQLGDTVYGAQYDVTKGKMVVDKAEVDLGDLTWNYDSTSKRFDAIINTMKQQAIRTLSMNCSCYLVIDDGRPLAQVPNGSIYNYTSGGVYVHDTRYTDATQFKTAVTGQQLVYELATPITIPLTPQQIKLLENTNTLYTDYEGDTITIEYQPNNAIGEAVRIAEAIIEPGRPILKCKRFEARCYETTALIDCTDSAWDSNKLIVPVCMQMTNQTQIQSYDMYFYGLRYVINNPNTDTWKVQAYIQHRTTGVSFNEWIEIALWYYELEV